MALLLSASIAGAGGFTLVSQTDEYPDLNQSVFNFRNNETGGGCTGSKLTNDGHALTAFHCLRDCLLRAGWFDETTETANQAGETVKVFRQTREHAPVTCKLLVPQVEVNVIDAPKCIAYTATADGKLGRIAESAPDGCDKSKDALTIKLPPAVLAGKTCAPLSSGPAPHLNDKVFSIGFPSATFTGSNDSDGSSEYRSYGTVMRQQSCVWTSSNGSRLLTVFPFTLGPDVLQVSVSAVPKSSGSPLFNASGEIVGVASGIYSPLMNAGTYCAGGVFFSNLSVVKISEEILRGNSLCTKE